mmetsp:Transcript_1253/g.2993  ORF Transcript_1253/g.2993 Transcript_1253/m.2993 type:complete len:365 (+) Transcript_1253:1918-3012(+)
MRGEHDVFLAAQRFDQGVQTEATELITQQQTILKSLFRIVHNHVDEVKDIGAIAEILDRGEAAHQFGEAESFAFVLAKVVERVENALVAQRRERADLGQDLGSLAAELNMISVHGQRDHTQVGLVGEDCCGAELAVEQHLHTAHRLQLDGKVQVALAVGAVVTRDHVQQLYHTVQLQEGLEPQLIAQHQRLSQCAKHARSGPHQQQLQKLHWGAGLHLLLVMLPVHLGRDRFLGAGAFATSRARGSIFLLWQLFAHLTPRTRMSTVATAQLGGGGATKRRHHSARCLMLFVLFVRATLIRRTGILTAGVRFAHRALCRCCCCGSSGTRTPAQRAAIAKHRARSRGVLQLALHAQRRRGRGRGRG